MVQTHSLGNHNPVGPHMVLKDVWLEDVAQTEKQIQEAIFTDIRTFSFSPSWRKDPRLKGMAPEVVDNLGRLFKSGDYKRLFLTIERYHYGQVSKPPAPNSERITGLFKTPSRTASVTSATLSTEGSWTPQDCTHTVGNSNAPPRPDNTVNRQYVPKSSIVSYIARFAQRCMTSPP